MAGRITKSEAQLRPDPRYGDKVLAKFINCVMLDGKKNTAQRVVYGALDIIEKKMKKEGPPIPSTVDPESDNYKAPEDALAVFHRALDNVRPDVEVRSKRVGGANYQVPMQVSQRRRQSLCFRWIISAARKEKGKPMGQRLARELWDAARREGKAMSTREQTHRMAEANRAFAHFAW